MKMPGNCWSAAATQNATVQSLFYRPCRLTARHAGNAGGGGVSDRRPSGRRVKVLLLRKPLTRWVPGAGGRLLAQTCLVRSHAQSRQGRRWGAQWVGCGTVVMGFDAQQKKLFSTKSRALSENAFQSDVDT
ncbi:MAG: hypothetical protein IPJ38_18870 [Dechloromonas sp.]|uniref:Uncharacterized protein n=1 Tax=Candidatus Dechloromonas phosphorivorans TaxID=2899244 RepID=A0A935MX84_9RHOO|nr:hypothetical protein [Candidatus Dechloromonas phosphorivorans]